MRDRAVVKPLKVDVLREVAARVASGENLANISDAAGCVCNMIEAAALDVQHPIIAPVLRQTFGVFVKSRASPRLRPQ